MPKVLIAGGGSGGHVTPAIAVAESLTDLGADILIAHSGRTIDSVLVDHSPFEGIQLPAFPLSMYPIGLARFCVGFILTNNKVRKIVRNCGIDCVLATGGFVAAPALRAAQSSECPTVLLNLDDPPGKANRLAIRWADQVLTTVACSLKNAIQIDPPLRQCVINTSTVDTCKTRLGLDPHRMTLLVTGASQGASSINELVPELARRFTANFKGWQVLHLAGPSHVDSVRESWIDIDVSCKVLGFHHEMSDVWGAADLAITRGGANTIAEIAMNAVPAIVMPYPYHTDDHQRTNAQPLAHIGGVVIETDHIHVEQNIANAGSTIMQLLGDHQSRFTMRQVMVTTPITNGSSIIADTCMACIEVARS